MKARWSPGNENEVSIICSPHKVNFLLDGWEGLRTRPENYIPLEKKHTLQSKGSHFKKICHHDMRGKILSIVLHTAQHGLYTSNLLPTPMQSTCQIAYNDKYMS